MRELIRSSDVILVDMLRVMLEGADIPVVVADNHMSALEGMIGAFPRRLLVPSDHAAQARRLVREAGYGAELRDG